MAETAPNPARSKGLALIAVVFLLGMVCGASLFYLGQRSVQGFPGSRPQAYELDDRRRGGPRGGPSERIFDGLGLDAEQKDRVASVLRESRTRMNRLLEESRVEIRDLLTEEQQEKFDELRPPRRRRGRPPWGKGPPLPPPGEGP
jgi:Spy/CpxP family protein refolding chaperone